MVHQVFVLDRQKNARPCKNEEHSNIPLNSTWHTSASERRANASLTYEDHNTVLAVASTQKVCVPTPACDAVLIPDSTGKHFNEVADDYDAIKNALFDVPVCERTDDPQDRVSTTDLLQAVNNSLGLRLSWNQLLPEIKRHQLKYDRAKRLNGRKGVVLGVKWTQTYLDAQFTDD